MMRIALMTVVLAALLLPAAAARACPMCKDTIDETANVAQPQDRTAGPQASLPGGFNFSIYYMLGGLFCTIGLVAGVITKGIRDSNASMRRGFPPHR
jgi:hypothetical protein